MFVWGGGGGGGGGTVDEKSYQTSWATLTFTAGGRVWIRGDCGGVCSMLCVFLEL